MHISLVLLSGELCSQSNRGYIVVDMTGLAISFLDDVGVILSSRY